MKCLNQIKSYLLFIVALFTLISCGGGGGGGTPATPANPDEIKTGQFLDHAVEGLAYSTGSQSGLTNAQGEFLYKQGETITFSIGNIILGTVDVASMLTPMDLVPGATSYNDATVINMLRLIQTLDADNNPDNGIEITTNVTLAAITALDFAVSSQEFENAPDVMALITAATSQTQLVDTKEALHHFQKTLAEIDNTAAYLLGGQVFGLNGALVLQNNNGDNLSLSANDTFTFNTTILEGAAYTVTVLTQPAGQTCVVTNGTGSNVMADVTSILVSCTDNRYVIGGNVSGLNGAVVLQNNGADDVTVAADGAFTFNTTVLEGGDYNVTVLTQPMGQICSVGNGTGTGISADVATVSVICSSTTYTVGGMITGLNGSVTLRNNGADDLVLIENGTFGFTTPIAEGGGYTVSVSSQPAGQICAVTNATGTNVTADINNVGVNCVNLFTVGGNVSGLTGSVTVQNNGGGDLTLSSNGTFTFSTNVTEGASYNVTIVTQPIGQTCSVTNGTGSNVTTDTTTVSISCSTNTYTVGGSVFGLTGPVVLQNNGGDDLTVSADGAFSFSMPVSYNGSYAVTVKTQPTGKTCTVTNGSGSNIATDINSVSIVCDATIHTIGGNITGLSGSVVLQNNGGDDLTASTNGAFTFLTPVPFSSGYSVTVLTQPTGQTCTVTNGSGSNVTTDITTVSISCSTNIYTVGGNVSGLAGSVVLQNSGGDDLTVNANGSFTFSAPVSYNGSYTVTVLTQPTGQTCIVTNGAASNILTDISTVSVSCAVTTYNIGGNIIGLSGSVVLQNNGGDNLSISANGPFTFSTPVSFNGSYAVTVQTQPAGQTCTVANGAGNNVTVDINTVSVNCDINTYSVGGSVTGLTGSMALQNNGGDDLTVSANGSFTFLTSVPYSDSYTITVSTQPSGQYCTVTNGTATITADVTNVAIGCVDRAQIADIVYQECSSPLPNGDSSFCNPGTFKACVDSDTAAQGWLYVDEVTFLNCSSSNIDDPRDTGQFPNLTGIELGNNPLNQIVSVFFNLPGIEYINVVPNERFPAIEIDIVVDGLASGNIQAFMDSLSIEDSSIGSIKNTLIDYVDNSTAFTDGKVHIKAGGKMWGYSISLGFLGPVGNQTCTFPGNQGNNFYNFGLMLDDNPDRFKQVTVLCESPYSSAAPLITARFMHSSAVLNEEIFVLGGQDLNIGGLVDVEVYNPDTNIWRSAAPMPAGKMSHSSVVLNGKLYVIGGRSENSTNGLSSVEVYEAVSDSWSSVAPLPVARYSHSSVTLNGKIYVIGGTVISDPLSQILSAVDVYDPVTDSWASVAPLSTPVYGHSSVVVNGKIYVFGGDDGVNYHSSVEVYDPVSNSWSAAAPFSIKRYLHSSVVLQGKVYVIGGEGDDVFDGNFGKLSSVEIYDPVTNSWVSNGDVPYASILNHTSEAINGKYYLLAGEVDFDFTDLVRIYDPLLDSTNPFNSPDLFSNTPNVVIPDDPLSPVVTFINVVGTGQSVSSTLTIDMEIQHTFIGDLSLVLTSPSGTAVTLWNRTGGPGDTLVGTFPTTLTVAGDLSVLNGEPLDGAWTLEITDLAVFDTGSLISWGIRP